MEDNNINNEQPKKKSNVGIIVLLIILVLGLVGYICYDKFYKKELTKTEEKENKNDTKEDEKTERPTTEEDQIYDADDGAISCNTKTRNLVYISYKDFDDNKLTKNDVCNTYVIEEFNAKLIPKQMILQDNEVDFSQWKIIVNGKEQKLDNYGYLSLKKFKTYYVIEIMTLGGGYKTYYFYDVNGNLKTKLAYSDGKCPYDTEVFTENSVILKQYYATKEAIDENFDGVGSYTCENDAIVESKCNHPEAVPKLVDIRYELVEENGNLTLKEIKDGYDCKFGS